MAHNDNPATTGGADTVALAPSITSRFLFVDVAAQRAKQLRRGAVPRVERPAGPHKLERLAMQEVRSGLIQYTLPIAPEVGWGRGAYQQSKDL
ncbi:MAG: DNA-directed RNA polymerase subunit omega [Vicinamibacterales bacterium]